MTDKEKREFKDGIISIFKRFNILDHTSTIGGLRDDILRYINSLKEEPVSTRDKLRALSDGKQHLGWLDDAREVEEELVSEELEEAARNIRDRLYLEEGKRDEFGNPYFLQNTILKAVIIGAKWQKEKDEYITEDLGNYINELSKQFQEVSFAKLSRIAVRVTKWQKEHLWKPADGDDLPEIDREVVVLIKYDAQLNIYDEEYPTCGVGFGHRPDPKGWDGKSLSTGKVEHYTPKTYDKGGWNIPNVVYWLDCLMPNLEED